MINQEFLLDLLRTPSPSGQEVAIQKKWLSYVKPFAHHIETDAAGNVIASLNPKSDFKVLLAGHCDEIAWVVKQIDENGFIRVEKLGGISAKPALGMKVDVLGKTKTLTGVFGVIAEHHGGAKDDFDVEDLYIDCGAKSKREIEDIITIGDPIIYRREPEVLANGRLTGRGLDNRTGAFIVAEVLRNCAEKGVAVGVYAASTVNEETNMGGAYFATSKVKPTLAIACDVTFATDYPGVNREKHGDVKLDGGPVLAKGAPINVKINEWLEEAASRLGISVQYELTPSATGTDADKMRLTGTGVPVALVSLPLRYMHSPVETVSLADIEREIELLTEFLTHLTGKENVNPIEL